MGINCYKEKIRLKSEGISFGVLSRRSQTGIASVWVQYVTVLTEYYQAGKLTHAIDVQSVS